MRKASKTEKALEAEISLVRWTSGGEQGWSLRVEDSASGLQMIEARLSDEQLGQLLGSRIAKTPITYWANPNIGKVQENTRIMVPLAFEDFPRHGDEALKVAERSDARRRSILAAQRVQGFPPEDGWKAEPVDRFNGHRVKEGGYEVSLYRYVDPS